jgi:hypothetical protein
LSLRQLHHYLEFLRRQSSFEAGIVHVDLRRVLGARKKPR